MIENQVSKILDRNTNTYVPSSCKQKTFMEKLSGKKIELNSQS